MSNERNNNYYKKRNSNRRNGFRQNRNNNFNRNKPRALETIEDVKQDIIRIEKEIELEIREIKNVKLGL